MTVHDVLIIQRKRKWFTSCETFSEPSMGIQLSFIVLVNRIRHVRVGFLSEYQASIVFLYRYFQTVVLIWCNLILFWLIKIQLPKSFHKSEPCFSTYLWQNRQDANTRLFFLSFSNMVAKEWQSNGCPGKKFIEKVQNNVSTHHKITTLFSMEKYGYSQLSQTSSGENNGEEFW